MAALFLDLPTVAPILTAIFGSPDYVAFRGAGDFCLPGCDYQPLHSDMGDRRTVEVAGKTRTVGSFHDPAGRLSYRDLPCPFVSCNFLMVDFTRTNGPMRLIPGTQHSHQERSLLKCRGRRRARRRNTPPRASPQEGKQ